MFANTIRKLTNRSYAATMFKKYRHIARAHKRDRDTLVIYQMGKVGSSSIKKSIHNASLDMNVYHVHALTHQRISELEQVYKNASKVHGRAVVHSHLAESKYLRSLLDKGTEGRRWKLITMVRDPVARNFSSFFQSFDQFFPEIAKKYQSGSVKMEDDVDFLAELFIKKFDHDMPLRWFDAYLKTVFDIDVYAHNFPEANGYSTYNGPRADMLLLRLEDMDEYAAPALGNFLDLKEPALQDDNRAEGKSYQSAYRDFKSAIVLPDTYIDKMYESKFARHFYSSAELEAFKSKWVSSIDVVPGT